MTFPVTNKNKYKPIYHTNYVERSAEQQKHTHINIQDVCVCMFPVQQNKLQVRSICFIVCVSVLQEKSLRMRINCTVAHVYNLLTAPPRFKSSVQLLPLTFYQNPPRLFPMQLMRQSGL